MKIIDYKTGNTSFDLVSIYYGLQLQLVVYMDAAMQAEKRLYPECEVEPAGIFYYNVKDPMIQKTLQEDLDELDPEIMKKLKMNGLVSSDPDVIQKLDASAASLPLSYTTKGALRKGSSVASPQRFRLLNAYVKKKITEVQDSILTGKADASPYEIGNRKMPAPTVHTRAAVDLTVRSRAMNSGD